MKRLFHQSYILIVSESDRHLAKIKRYYQVTKTNKKSLSNSLTFASFAFTLREREHPNFEKITAATPKTLLNSLTFVSFAFFAVHSY
ncbi:PAP/fibrillin family protein [Sphaerospermopsis torques-reginae]|uniref:PAP/fibrillin family protein n=1 Tax=Sphaerospermopsis torques-reginae ITEP-024 TaxID=984208 RepID=A0ABX8WUK1_9CYAN|nr:PAP/fibrillin family protein [Sphaerospermopsis torques-reginae]QYX30080.1 PAP/fibrillin family protein [Sphaerospermopsis torques-reginae ITEP-024]